MSTVDVTEPRPDAPAAPADQPAGQGPDTPTGHHPAPPPAEEFGITDPLGALLDRFGVDTLDGVLEAIDRRGSIRVTGEAIEFRGLLRSRSVRLDHVTSIELRTPLAVAQQVVPFWRGLVMLMPAARVGRLVKLAVSAVPALSSEPVEVDAGELDRPVLATIRRTGPNVNVRGTTAIVALLNRRLADRLVEEAERRGIPVVAKR